MTRVLAWNIRQLGINKVNNPIAAVLPGMGGFAAAVASVMRRVLFNHAQIFADPDIIVIVEVASGDNRLSDLATQTGGVLGVEYLLNQMRGGFFANGNWRMVPPLRVGTGGRTETVAVLYKGSILGGGQRIFTGPNRWVGGYNGWSTEPGVGVAGNAYPAPAPGAAGVDFDQMLVPPGTAPRAIPAAALHNGGANENTVAARNRFRMINAGAPDGFIDFSGLREPYMATFAETNAAGVVVRNLSLFGVHSPAVAGNTRVFTSAMASMYDVVGPLGATETRGPCGGFNINLLNANCLDSGDYAPLTNNGYTLLLPPPPPGAPAPANPDQFKGYFTTHIKPSPGMAPTQASRFLWSVPGGALSPYPGYNYKGSNVVPDFYSIDNILVRPYQAVPYNTTILNFVTGSPFNAGGVVPPVNAPAGVRLMPTTFVNIPWPPTPNAAPWPGIGPARGLIRWSNYGVIWSLSDHFGLVADIP